MWGGIPRLLLFEGAVVLDVETFDHSLTVPKSAPHQYLNGTTASLPSSGSGGNRKQYCEALERAALYLTLHCLACKANTLP